MKIAVVGAGVAGTAAAWRASLQAEVIVLHAGAGATALGCGAHDVGAWGACSSEPLGADALRFSGELGCFSVGAAPAVVVTQSGQPRYARAADRAVLDLSKAAGGKVAVSDLGRWGYDARVWARALNESRWAAQTHTHFEALSGMVPAADAVRANDYDFAALHDDEARTRTLGDALAKHTGYRALLLPPALGVVEPVHERLRQRLGYEVGECLSLPAGPAGARFELARDALLGRRKVQLLQTRLISLLCGEAGFRLQHESAAGEVHSVEVERVILACGGIVSGGLRLGATRLGDPASFAFEPGWVSSEALPLQLDGRLLERVASLHGFDFDRTGLGALERVAVLADGGAVHGIAGLYAAGQLQGAGSSLAAVQSGCQAALAALGNPPKPQ